MMKQSRDDVALLAQALLDMKDRTQYCSRCQNITEHDPCPICSSPKREGSLVCVVEEPSDVLAVEKTNDYHGLYHVLGGVINPLEGIGPDDLKVRELLERMADGTVSEVILALNPTIEGEMTTLYLAKLLKPLGLVVTRIARGIPLGSELQFVDEATIARAIEGRVIV